MEFPGFEKVHQGAEARLYVGTYLGRPTVLKERFQKKYRLPELDKQITTQRIKAEARMITKCKALGIRTPAIYFVDMTTGCMYMEHLASWTTYRDFLMSSPQPAAELEVSKAVGEAIGRMHGASLAHGDPTTSNVMILQSGDPTEVALIDFGLSRSEASAEDLAVDLYVLERALLSTHPGSEHVFQAILQGYGKQLSGKHKSEVQAKLAEVQARGRKRLMVG